MLGEILAHTFRSFPDFRGRRRILDRLLPNTGMRRASIYGHKMWLDLSDYMQRNIFMGTYEPDETRWIKCLLRPGMTFVDVGANVGYYVALGAQLVGSTGKVIAFEPCPSLYKRLSSLAESIQVPEVSCFQLALSDQPGDLTLYIPPDSYHNQNPSATPYCSNMNAVSVRAETLDGFIERNGMHRIDLLKMDVEGHEPKILTGAEKSIRSGKIRAILAEFHPRILSRVGSSPEILNWWLSQRGFTNYQTTLTNRLLIYNPQKCAKLMLQRAGHPMRSCDHRQR